MTTDPPMKQVTVAAVDLGASSGRVMLARVGDGGVELTEVHRFANGPVTRPGGSPGQPELHWDLTGLFTQVLAGLRAVSGRLAPGERLASIGIDSWAVDYGLLDRDGQLIGEPFCYRDDRTSRPGGGVARVHAVAGHEELYTRNGLQFLPFNTVYQLASEPAEVLDRAQVMLLVPDLIAYWLTGQVRAEVTNASTTGLLNVVSGQWDEALAARLGIPGRLLAPLIHPGATIGTLTPGIAQDTGLPADTPVTAVGSHDTASAVVAIPATGHRFGYISCGTWSLVGVELAEPVLTAASRAANFTNEGGVDGRVRYLRNVMGLWLLSESLRVWEQQGSPEDLDRLLAAAAEVGDGGPVIDVGDPGFLPPGDLPGRIATACRTAGLPVPPDRPALVRCILDSLAAAYARTIQDAVRLTGRPVDVVHIVGGGSQNALLCDLTARATSLPVVAGPVEATAIGNALVQARAAGRTGESLEALRDRLRAAGAS